ncbi:MAG TPA: DHH family phosphoesterase [Candidatus Limnocylindrales bacterium]|nr:DHH family phosphoesterase [Candidatus Limnocylindrales bacterium]
MIDLGPFAGAVPDRVVERFSSARRILSVGHENPDGDSLGASMAVAIVAERLGARVDVMCGDPVPQTYSYMPGIERVQMAPDEAARYDLLVVSDCGSLDRIGPVRDAHAELFASLPHLVIDHHASNDHSDPGSWIDPTAAATCEMVALLATRLGVPLSSGDGDLAAALLSGIVMDTATFAHPNASPRTLVVAAALLEAGGPLSEISRRLYRTKPDAQLRLFGLVLGRSRTTHDGRVVYSTMTDADLEAAGAIAEHSEGIIDLLSQSETAEVTVLLKEKDDGVRLSVRTKPDGVDATELTGFFGGGGHARAAGATIDLPLLSALEAVLREAQRLAAAVHRA